ncbi:50S ribosomal protein L22 [Candidatus Parcubacteria bacterium]|nr:50S ribosomal protein L22 [Candidatus Parcubacteria bacterium]
MSKEVVAKTRYIRMSPRKVGLVVDLVRGLSVVEARRRLRFSAKRAAGPVLKVLESAVANAKQTSLKEESLVVAHATADPGPTLKRGRPGPRGRLKPILKRTSHITIKLAVGGNLASGEKIGDSPKLKGGAGKNSKH